MGFLQLKLINFTTKLPNWINVSYYRVKLWRRGICAPTNRIILHQTWEKKLSFNHRPISWRVSLRDLNDNSLKAISKFSKL